MAGRNHKSRHLHYFPGVHNHPHPILHRQQFPPHPAAIEKELELQRREIQGLVAANRHVIDDNVMLERDLIAVKAKIHRLNQVISKLNAEQEIHRRELIERGMKLESELQAAEPLRSEIAHLRVESQNLNSLRNELSSQVENLKSEISQLQSENKQITVMRTDIEKMQQELAEARKKHENVKKGNEELVEQNRFMEKNLISMTQEIEILHAELANAEKRGTGTGGYVIPETRYPGQPYSNIHIAGAWGSYDKHLPPWH